ncbi:MAG: hypothetical protein O7J95_02670 [Planctomycetota bacterium]|nr:hypothetical protein [Planctomycetota bacterium]
MIPVPLKASELLDKEYLELRAKILEVAATLDRLDRADGDVSGDPRSDLLRRGIAELAKREADRAERLQLIFSLAYDETWRRPTTG